jgi:hypothetical protein
MTKYGIGPDGVIWLADVRLSKNRQPLANNSSAMRTSRRAPGVTTRRCGIHRQIIGEATGAATRLAELSDEIVG